MIKKVMKMTASPSMEKRSVRLAWLRYSLSASGAAFRSKSESRPATDVIKFDHRGQALLPVLIVLAIVLVLGIGVLHLSIGSMLISFSSREGEQVLVAAEGALENGLMRVLRNPAYPGESLQVGGIPCTIEVSGQSPALVLAECDDSQAIRRLQAEVSFINGEMLVANYQEVE